MSLAKNSITEGFKDYIKVSNNALQLFNKMYESLYSDKDFVDFNLLKSDNTVETISLPSFTFFKKEIDTLKNTVKSVTSPDTSDVFIKLEDGSFSRVIKNIIKSAPEPINTINIDNTFTPSPNFFFEDFLNPLLQIKIDLTNKVNNDTKRVLVERWILKSTNEQAIDFFDTFLSGNNNINYETFLSDIESNGFKFTNDREFREFPPIKNIFYGDFSVLSFNGNLITLNKTRYNRNDIDLEETELIQIGDNLILRNTNGEKTTRFKVVEVFPDRNQVRVQLIEGFDPIRVGSNVLSIFKPSATKKNLNIPVTYNERFVIFIKPVDPFSDQLANKWSSGLGIFSNVLTTVTDNGATVPLTSFYANNVSDFGKFIESYFVENTIPVLFAEKPAPPIVSGANFKVQQINTHLTDETAFKEVKDSNTLKVSLQNEIKTIDRSIDALKATLNTKQYSSPTARQVDENELNQLMETRTKTSELYNNTVAEINQKIADAGLNSVSPKYRVRGFWEIPPTTSSRQTRPQEIVQFIIQYRYKSKSGNSPKTERIEIDNGNETTSGVFSDWIEFTSKPKERVFDETQQRYIWKAPSVSDADAININQAEIPISPKERVEIRIKSVSEAGYPTNPVLSEWSQIVSIEFPDDIVVPDVKSVKSATEKEALKADINSELKQKGLDEHLTSGFTVNGKYYAHNAINIASGFLTPEQSPISLFDKIAELQAELKSVKERFQDPLQFFEVRLLDEDGNVLPVPQSTTTQILAGYYKDDVGLNNKGAIVTKRYYLELFNKGSNDIKMFSLSYGNRRTPTNLPVSGVSDFQSDIGKYAIVPLSFVNAKYEESFGVPLQDRQLNGQYMYRRHTTIDGTYPMFLDFDNPYIELYDGITFALENEFKGDNAPKVPLGVQREDWFVWDFTYHVEVDNTTGEQKLIPVGIPVDFVVNYQDSLLIHKNHPIINNLAFDIVDLAKKISEEEDPNGNFLDEILVESDDGTQKYLYHKYARFIRKAALKHIKHARLFNADNSIDEEKPFAKAQMQFKNVPFRGETFSTKCSFEEEDKFLLGGKSCGAYLFAAPINEDVLAVNGDDRLSFKALKPGGTNSIKIPIMFQYRMTDYAGENETGEGFIKGDELNETLNVTYSKLIGFDIYLGEDKQRYSFDLEFFAKYRSQNITSDSIPTKSLSAAYSDATSINSGNNNTSPSLF